MSRRLAIAAASELLKLCAVAAFLAACWFISSALFSLPEF